MYLPGPRKMFHGVAVRLNTFLPRSCNFLATLRRLLNPLPLSPSFRRMKTAVGSTPSCLKPQGFRATSRRSLSPLPLSLSVRRMKTAIGATHAPPLAGVVLIGSFSASIHSVPALAHSAFSPVHFVPAPIWFVPASVLCAEVSVGEPLRPHALHRYPSRGEGV